MTRIELLKKYTPKFKEVMSETRAKMLLGMFMCDLLDLEGIVDKKPTQSCDICDKLGKCDLWGHQTDNGETCGYFKEFVKLEPALCGCQNPKHQRISFNKIKCLNCGNTFKTK